MFSIDCKHIFFPKLFFSPYKTSNSRILEISTTVVRDSKNKPILGGKIQQFFRVFVCMCIYIYIFVGYIYVASKYLNKNFPRQQDRRRKRRGKKNWGAAVIQVHSS